jgi:hypothetical protein
LPNGGVFTVGGSWSGGLGNKNGELWTSSAGWKLLPGVLDDPLLAPDPAGIYRADNHMWLFAVANDQVLQAGPSADSHWIDTGGKGRISSAGSRGNDAYSMNGNAVLYDIGKLLKIGGAPAYENANATNSAYVINIKSGIHVRAVEPMAYSRAMHNSVVLPSGQVVVVGGQAVPKPFSDDRSVLVPELWDPTSETFTTLAPMQVPRNYHSVALLLLDGRVFSAGGGLCGGCATNHYDAQIFTPPYLLNFDGTPATQPKIVSAPSSAALGKSILVTTDSAVTSFVLMRMGSSTHSVNTDQRRVPLKSTSVGSNAYFVHSERSWRCTPGLLHAVRARQPGSALGSQERADHKEVGIGSGVKFVSRPCRIVTHLLMALGMLWPPFTSAAQTPSESSARRGEQLFDGDEPIKGMLPGHDEALPAFASKCINCHRTTSGPADSSQIVLTRSALLFAAPRRGGPPSRYGLVVACFCAMESIQRKSSSCIPMPRYDLDDAQCLDLWNYVILPRIDAHRGLARTPPLRRSDAGCCNASFIDAENTSPRAGLVDSCDCHPSAGVRLQRRQVDNAARAAQWQDYRRAVDVHRLQRDLSDAGCVVCTHTVLLNRSREAQYTVALA